MSSGFVIKGVVLKIELRQTVDIGSKLKTTELYYENIPSLINAVTEWFHSGLTCFIEVEIDDELRVTVAHSESAAHLALWKNCEEPVYLFNGSVEGFIDIGWNSFPASNTTTEIDKLLSSIEIFLESGALSAAFEWVEDGE